jgi:hypothetical protein
VIYIHLQVLHHCILKLADVAINNRVENMKIKCVLLKADKMLHEQKYSPAKIVFSYFISTFIMFDKGILIF